MAIDLFVFSSGFFQVSVFFVCEKAKINFSSFDELPVKEKASLFGHFSMFFFGFSVLIVICIGFCISFVEHLRGEKSDRKLSRF
jgi:hypothetical protein